MSTIFVQIASYRDAELLPTLRDLFAKSAGKHQITVGLVWQKDDHETIQEFENDSRVRIISCDWKESRGLGWARNLVQTMYNNEDYTIQLDSHHRFAQDWDSILVDMLEELRLISNKPLLTAPPAGYDPDNDKQLTPHLCITLPIDFKKGGTIQFNPIVLGDTEKIVEPIRARFISGGFYFTLGQHCKEFIYDPDIYFAGDEISLSVRSYTLGYDLYHPHKNVIWHYYGRNNQPKHWGDHNNNAKEAGHINAVWSELDSNSKKRIRKLLGENNDADLGDYGLGSERSLYDYGKYAGIDFVNKRIQKSAITGKEPPVVFENDQEYENDFKKTFTIDIATGWDKKYFIELYNNLNDTIVVEYVSLRQDLILSQKINKELLIYNDTYKIQIEVYNEPMRINFIGYDKNNNTRLCRAYVDLKDKISWF